MSNKGINRKLIIIGASGHGKVVADIALLNGYNDIVFCDDNTSFTECMGFPIVGRTEDAIDMDGDKIVAIGNPQVRERLQDKINAVTLIHPDATIGINVALGAGCVVMAGGIINPNTTIGKGVIINTSASVDHDCVIGDYAHIAVGAHVCGSVRVGKRTWIGAGATVRNNTNICDDCIIGVGAAVVDDIDNPGTYVGVPAKKIK